eukprot:Colp12_sorted_trinity150504_noHs@21242
MGNCMTTHHREDHTTKGHWWRSSPKAKAQKTKNDDLKDIWSKAVEKEEKALKEQKTPADAAPVVASNLHAPEKETETRASQEHVACPTQPQEDEKEIHVESVKLVIAEDSSEKPEADKAVEATNSHLAYMAKYAPKTSELGSSSLTSMERAYMAQYDAPKSEQTEMLRLDVQPPEEKDKPTIADMTTAEHEYMKLYEKDNLKLQPQEGQNMQQAYMSLYRFPKSE